MTRASVIIPCHNKSLTLPYVVDSVLRQTVPDLEVLLVGDGVTEAARGAIEELVAADPRVRFLDFPKGIHHGEAYRHEAVMAATSDAIFYLCDDDLFLPDHVSDLLHLLENATLVQCLNGYLLPDASFGTYASDLADGHLVAAIMDESIRFNSVSITGTAHRRSFYLEAEQWWEAPPHDQWSDHHQFRRMMRQPGFVGATSDRVTALQLPTSTDGREAWGEDQRVAELASWHTVVTGPDPQPQIDEIARSGFVRTNAELRVQMAWDRAQIESLQGSLRDADARVVELERRAYDLSTTVSDLRGSWSWRVTAPLRWLVRLLTTR